MQTQARRVDYGELPPDSEFVEVGPLQYAIARTYAATGGAPKEIAAKLATTSSHVSKELMKLRRRCSCDDLNQLLYVLRTKQTVLVEVHDRRLTGVSPAAPAERKTRV